MATREEFALIFKDHKLGQSILDDLDRRFNGAAVLDGGVDAVIKTYYRSGQRSVIDYIKQQLAKEP